jgi:type I restriction enzyme S subunit
MSKVEWKNMWELTAWDKKFQGVDKSMQSKIIPYTYLLAKDLFALSVPTGNIKLLSTGVQEGWTTEELAGDFLSEGEVVTIPWGKSPGAQNPVKYYKGKFVTGDNRIATSLDTNVLNNKFLYYWMYSNSDVIETFYRGAGIQHPSMFKVLTMPVPLLSISEQKRIVGILDTFTASIDNLKEQIAQRRKQYEYYRDQLLDLEGKEGVKILVLETIAEIGTGSSNTQDELEIGKYPFFVRSQIVRWKNEYEYDETAIITSGDGVGVGKVLHYYEGKYALHQRAYRIHIVVEDFVPKFLYYYMQKDFYNYIMLNAYAASVTSVRKPMLLKYPIQVPPLSEQQRIVDILDKFEASIQNLEAQLSQREKQYEYYRNKLLTFE